MQNAASDYAAKVQHENREGLVQAHRLAAHLVAGGALPQTRTGLLLEAGEQEHAHLWAQLSSFYALENVQHRSTFFAFGGLPMLAATAAASLAVNQHRKAKATA